LEILYEWNLYDVIDAWIVATADRVGTSGVADHRCVGEIGNHEPDAHDAYDPWQNHQELVCLDKKIKSSRELYSLYWFQKKMN